MSITERAALEGLRLRCIDELAKGNRRMATAKEADEIYLEVSDNLDLRVANLVDNHLAEMPLFECLERWLNLKGGLAVPYHDLIAGIAIDILNKEEERERRKDN